MTIPHIWDYPGGRIHLIGIGGSSMSGLARMLIEKGYRVSGSDRTDGYLMDSVRASGAEVMIGHRAENVHGADLVVYSAAVHEDNPERSEAKRLGIPQMERAYLLGQLMSFSALPIAVCGAHGKTTTTSMLAQILVENGCDPSVHIGGSLDAIGGSTRVGQGGAFVAEACEYNRSFLQIHPKITVTTNIDAEHLDCYRDIDEIQATFAQFMSMVPEDGMAIGNGDDPRVKAVLAGLRCPVATYGMGAENDWHPANLTEDGEGCCAFDIVHNGETVAHVQLAVPGQFNAMDALGAIAAAAAAGVAPADAARVLAHFTGAHRRFEKTGTLNGCEMYTDYGHNPVEMRNALSIARKHCKGRLIAVMQPHTFSRVKTLFDDYLTSTEAADITLVTDICAAREADPGDINSGMLVEGMRRHGIDAVWTPSFDDTENWLREHVRPGDLALTMGCGDINMLNVQINRHEQERQT